MLVYWTMLGIPALGALFGLDREKHLHRLNAILLFVLFVAYVLLIGLREEVGADWFGYQAIIRDVQYERLGTALSHYDPAFNLVAWISSNAGFGMYGVNFVCGLLLLYGTFRFAQTLPSPWMALSAAVPYLLIVVGMGYVRQAAAVGLCMLSFRQLQRDRYVLFVLTFGLGMTFHVGALSLAPIMAAAVGRRSALMLAVTTALGVLVFSYILAARLDSMQSIYVTGKLDSSGALVRLLMTAIPGALFLALRSRFPVAEPMKTAWTLMAIASLVLLGAFAVSSSSTAIDRIGLFFSPLQVMVFGYLTTIFGRTSAERNFASVAVIGYCAAILFVWLQFSFYAQFWVPYRSVL